MNVWKKLHGHAWTDETYDNAIAYLQDKTLPVSLSKDAKYNFINRLKYYTLEDDKLVHKTTLHPPWHEHTLNPGTDVYTFTVIKPSNVNNILSKFFTIESKMANNYKTLYEKVRRNHYLGISRNDVLKFLQNNPVNLKETTVKNDPLYVHSYRPLYPFEHWQIDLIDFRRIAKYNEFADKRYYNFILVIIDIFSKFIYLHPIEGIYDEIEKTSLRMSHEICNIVRKIFLLGDIPKKIGCDNQFNVKPFIELCNTFSVRPVFSMPHHPQTNGFVENKNKQIKGFIYYHFNRYHKESGFRYFDIIDHIGYSINNTKHSITQKTPNEIHRGRILPLPATHIEVTDVPESFIKAFPVLENSYNPKTQITKKSKMINIESSNDDNNVIQAYNKAAQTIYAERVAFVREKIHTEAIKREALYKKKSSVQRFKTSSLVKIRTYLSGHDDSKIQPIQLRLLSQDTEGEVVVLQNPLFRITSGKSIDTIAQQPKPSASIIKSQTEWKNMPDGLISVFKIKEIVLLPNKTIKYFRLVTFDNMFTVEHIVSLRPKVYSKNFTQQMLHHADYKDVKKEATYRPSYNNTLSETITIDNNINNINNQNMSNNTFKLKQQNTQYDYLANPKVKQLTQEEFDKIWEYVITNNKFDVLSSNEIVKWVKKPNAKYFTRVVGVLGNFIPNGKNRNNFWVTYYDGSEVIYSKRLVDLHTENSSVYVIQGDILEVNGDEYVFRFPYYIRKLFSL
tara:strand:+ start:5944 stop:8142 length:2199 start_codon:yes stop_codon:yes gene_type:complete